MSCALPGVWLVLRRQSLMGDALSHTALPGIVISFLFGQWLLDSGWIGRASLPVIEPLLLMTTATLVGIGTALLAESLHRVARVEATAALGVVFTSLFALGLLMVRLFADHTDLDPECVLLGQLELVIADTVPIGPYEVPWACISNGSVLLINSLLIWLFFKELRLVAFDPELATSLGINARLLNYIMMAATAWTLITAFRAVGSILVVGLLIVPAATGSLLTSRLRPLIGVAMVLAALSAVAGHLAAKTLPPLIFVPLGLTEVRDAGTAGMMAAAAGTFFLLALFLAPEKGLWARAYRRLRLALQIAGDDILGNLFRREEAGPDGFVEKVELSPAMQWLAPLYLRQLGYIGGGGSPLLTTTGRERARKVVRAHRLWESYMQKHFELPDDHLHATAHLVEHFLDEDLQERLFSELDSPQSDPHGRAIPESPAPSAN